MKLIIGLGNPGVKYESTRHNIGFLALDKIAAFHNISISLKGFDASYGKGTICNHHVILAKPQTFMNISGISVSKFAGYFKIDLSDLIVIHDDIDLPLTTIRIKEGGGHAGHKGLISIIDQFSDAEFSRVRIGIGRPPDNTTVERYVLESFTADEMNVLPLIIETASDAVTAIIASGIQWAMNKYNDRSISFQQEG